GQEIANRTLYVDKDMTVQLEIMHWRDFVERRQVNLRNTYTGNIKLLKDFYSPQLENYRDVIIYLPPDYESSGECYGVMYMHDGQNVFDATTSFAGVEWGADETAQELINSGSIRPIIIVGIYNKGVDRLDEYSPWVDESYGGGDGDLYAQFVVETLKPYIDSNFRTLPDRENTAITGSSMGGLISLYMGVKYNDIFSKIGVMSAAFWFANGEIMNYVKNADFEKQTKIYMDIGTAEGNDATVYLEGSRTMREILLSKANVELSYIEEKGGTHSESAWARRLPQLLTYFFGKTSK
ncbi:MAG TPA: alpha/beta hydrolase-fold protein, partial [Fervidobacterium sp.]|nr:alpha/beta hydrolase-fold protein [Fervidobacterium sp.]